MGRNKRQWRSGVHWWVLVRALKSARTAQTRRIEIVARGMIVHGVVVREGLASGGSTRNWIWDSQSVTRSSVALAALAARVLGASSQAVL